VLVLLQPTVLDHGLPRKHTPPGAPVLHDSVAQRRLRRVQDHPVPIPRHQCLRQVAREHCKHDRGSLRPCAFNTPCTVNSTRFGFRPPATSSDRHSASMRVPGRMVRLGGETRPAPPYPPARKRKEFPAPAQAARAATLPGGAAELEGSAAGGVGHLPDGGGGDNPVKSSASVRGSQSTPASRLGRRGKHDPPRAALASPHFSPGLRRAPRATCTWLASKRTPAARNAGYWRDRP